MGHSMFRLGTVRETPVHHTYLGTVWAALVFPEMSVAKWHWLYPL